MNGFSLAMGCFLVGLSIWAAGIRPYLSCQGKAVATGATWFVSAWADWQQCSDLARARNYPGAVALSRCFLLAQAGILTGIILALCRR